MSWYLERAFSTAVLLASDLASEGLRLAGREVTLLGRPRSPLSSLLPLLLLQFSWESDSSHFIWFLGFWKV